MSWQSFAVRAASWIEHEWFIVEKKSWKRTVNGWEGNKKSGGNGGSRRDVMDGMAVGSISCGSRLGFARLKEWISLACGIVIHMPLASCGSHMI